MTTSSLATANNPGGGVPRKKSWKQEIHHTVIDEVDFLSKIATSPDRSWVARELVVGNSTPAFAVPAVPTGKFVCGKAGQVPRECTPEPYVARTTELCVFPWTADGWPKTWRPVGVAPGKFGTPRLCPDSILHPEK